MSKDKFSAIMLSLKFILIANSVVTIVNIVIANLLPVILPVSSFSALKAVLNGILEINYLHVFLGLLIPVLLFLTAISIDKQKIILPIISLVYYLNEFLVVLKTTIDIHWVSEMHFSAMIVSFVTILLLCGYLHLYRRKGKNASVKQTDDSVVLSDEGCSGVIVSESRDREQGDGLREPF